MGVAAGKDETPNLSDEERMKIRLRIESIYKSLKPYRKDDMFYKILSEVRNKTKEASC